jgi:hypothetical protein
MSAFSKLLAAFLEDPDHDDRVAVVTVVPPDLGGESDAEVIVWGPPGSFGVAVVGPQRSRDHER